MVEVGHLGGYGCLRGQWRQISEVGITGRMCKRKIKSIELVHPAQAGRSRRMKLVKQVGSGWWSWNS